MKVILVSQMTWYNEPTYIVHEFNAENYEHLICELYLNFDFNLGKFNDSSAFTVLHSVLTIAFSNTSSPFDYKYKRTLNEMNKIINCMSLFTV